MEYIYLKILLVHTYFTNEYPIGINPIVFGTYETLKKHGHDVYIFAVNIQPYIEKNYPYTKYFPKASSFWANRKNLFSQIDFLFKNLYNIEAKNKLSKMLDEVKPDLVHIHSIADLSFSILQPIKNRNIPIIYTIHDIGLFCPAHAFVGTNYCYRCKRLNVFSCVTKQCFGKDFLKSIAYSTRAFFERSLGAFKYIDLYLPVSNAVKDYMIKMGIEESKIKVLPNFVDKSNIESEETKHTNKQFNYFFYAGGYLQKTKGVFTLLETAKILPKEIEFHIAGSGNFQDLETFIKENNLNNIKLLGKLTKTKMNEEFKNCISVIMPSEYFETFGMINIEAAIYGKPSISSNIGGLPEVVENNKTGLIFEPQNVEQLKQCILTYWNNRDLVTEHGKKAKEKVLKEYNEDLYLERLLNIYNEVIKK